MREARVAEGGGGVDADEEEEGAAEKEVEGGLRMDVGQDPVFPPAFGDKIEESVDVGKGESSGAFLIGYGGEEATCVIGVLNERRKRVLREMETEELMMLDEVFGD